MAGAVGSWILSKVRDLVLFPEWTRIKSTNNVLSQASEGPHLDPARVYGHHAVPSSSKREFRSLSPDFPLGLSVFPEFSRTPPSSPRTAGVKPAADSNLGARLDFARHAAIARGHKTPCKPAARPIFHHEQEEDDDDPKEGVEEQILSEIQAAAGQSTARKTVYTNGTPTYGAADKGSQSSLEADAPTYTLSWRVSEGNEVVRAALSLKSSGDPQAAPVLLRVVKAEKSSNQVPSMPHARQYVADMLAGRVDETDFSTPIVQPPDDIETAPSLVSGGMGSTVTQPSLGVNPAKKRKSSVLLAEQSTKRQKGVEHDAEVKTEGDKGQLETARKSTRSAAKRAKRATKSALWTEALHDETYLRRAEKTASKTSGRKI